MAKRLLSTCAAGLLLAAPAWAQVPAGSEFRVNAYTMGDQLQPRVAMEADGDFVVVWESQLDGSGYGVFGQRFSAAGLPRGTEFRVNTHTTDYQYVSDVAIDAQGRFVVVWQSYLQDGSYGGIFGQRFGANGTADGAEFIVNTITIGFQYRPRVARSADGRFVVVWTNANGGGGSFEVAARRFDAAGQPLGSEFVVNTYTTGDQVRASVAMASDGSFVVVWAEDNYRDGSVASIFGQRFDATGARAGADFQVSAPTTDVQRMPGVAHSPAGGFVVTWTGYAADGSAYAVLARRFDAAGAPQGGPFVVNTYTTGIQYVLGPAAIDGRGNFVVSWMSRGKAGGDDAAYGTFAQRFTASGAPRGAEFQVNTYTFGEQNGSVTASDPHGNFVVAWQSGPQDALTYGIYAQRFGGLAPAALAVDAGANGVFEPGETNVPVRPSWRNFNGAAQAFGGALSGFTGPAGATYTIADSTATYGVPNGETTPCIECYAVSVSNPSPRPAAHWDAMVLESVLPDAHGQQQEWVLHVGGSFADVPASNPYYRFIETLLHVGVTSGCSAAAYCPAAATSREQMAVFVLVAKEGAGYAPPACTTPVFADVPASNTFCRWIEELARRGVVGGCGGPNYCPSSSVTREQMAVFVLRTLDPALDPPACTTPMYSDVPASSPFCRWIEELTRRSVVNGCGGGAYCPTDAVTREQMGVFLGVAFGLTLYGV